MGDVFEEGVLHLVNGRSIYKIHDREGVVGKVLHHHAAICGALYKYTNTSLNNCFSFDLKKNLYI